MKLDAKFSGVITKTKDGTIVPPDQYVVFLAKDDAFYATLKFYEQECERLGAGKEQVEGVRALRERVAKWRVEHPELCKVPDIEPGELLIDKANRFLQAGVED